MSEKGETKISAIGADDPFFPRAGKSLTWTNVNMSVVSFMKSEFEHIVTRAVHTTPQSL